MFAFRHQERWDYCARLAFVILIASLILLPGLGSFGFWDPVELDVLDRARGSAGGTDPLTGWSIRAGLSALGVSELGARLPFSLLGIGVAVMTFVLAAHVLNRRAGLYAALLVVASPLIVLQSRQLTSDIGACFGQTCAMAGAALLLAPRRPRHRLVAVPLIVGGVVCAYCAVAWRSQPHSLVWSSAIEQVVFGAFPWIAVLPLAAHSAEPRLPRSVAWLAWAWALAAFATCTLLAGSRGTLAFSALPAMALPVAAWLDGIGRQRPRVPAVALTASGLLAVVVGRDLVAFPDRLASLHLAGKSVQHAGAVGGLLRVPLLISVGFATCIVVGALLPRQRWRSTAAGAAITVCLGFAVLVTTAWTPRWSRSQSTRHLFDVYRKARAAGDPLALVRVPPRSAAFYAPGAQHRDRGAVDRMLAARPRAFALVPDAMLCSLSQNARARNRPLHVLARSEAFVLVSNQHRDGDPRARGLDDAIRSTPVTPQRRIDAEFAEGIELLGVDMPSGVGRGDSFEVTLYFRVLRRPRRSWRVFVHFDRGSIRFQGDHWPLARRCPTTRWNPGDYIVDRFRVSAGNVTFPRGRYRVRAGFFVGSRGSFKNMAVTRGNADRHNRVDLGDLEVR